MYCARCGKPLPDNASYCPSCGALAECTTSHIYQQAAPSPHRYNSLQSPAAAVRKPITRRWWFWVLVIVIGIPVLCSVLAAALPDSLGTYRSTTPQSSAAAPNYMTSIQWALQESYLCAVERDDFDGDVIAAGTYLASLVAAEKPTGNQVPIVWDIYLSNNLYSSVAELPPEDYVGSVGGWDLASSEITVEAGQYLYVIYNDMAGEPIGIFDLCPA